MICIIVYAQWRFIFGDYHGKGGNAQQIYYSANSNVDGIKNINLIL